MNPILRECRRFAGVYRRVKMHEGVSVSRSGQLCESCYLPADFKIPPANRTVKGKTLCISCTERYFAQRKKQTAAFRADLLRDPDGRLRGVIYDV